MKAIFPGSDTRPAQVGGMKTWPVTWRNLSDLIGYVSEWEITFNGLSWDSRQRVPYSPYKPCNHSLYIGIIIFPYIDTTQSTGHK